MNEIRSEVHVLRIACEFQEFLDLASQLSFLLAVDWRNVSYLIKCSRL